MIVSVASGKGGTGKTTVAVNLALAKGKVHIVDTDVEAPNVHLFLKPQIEREEFFSIKIPSVIEEKCTYCGVCNEVCEFNAIFVSKNRWMLFKELCHGCGSCTYFCPEKALYEEDKIIGVIRHGYKGDIKFTGGELNIGEATAVPLIRAIKRNLKGESVVIVDAPPGTTCPVIESVKESDFVILVAEPTRFGVSDLSISIKVIKKLNIPFGVFINKSGMGETSALKELLRTEEVDVLGELPFDRRISELYSRGSLIVEEFQEYRKIFDELWQKVEEKVEGDSRNKR